MLTWLKRIRARWQLASIRNLLDAEADYCDAAAEAGRAAVREGDRETEARMTAAVAQSNARIAELQRAEKAARGVLSA